MKRLQLFLFIQCTQEFLRQAIKTSTLWTFKIPGASDILPIFWMNTLLPEKDKTKSKCSYQVKGEDKIGVTELPSDSWNCPCLFDKIRRSHESSKQSKRKIGPIFLNGNSHIHGSYLTEWLVFAAVSERQRHAFLSLATRFNLSYIFIYTAHWDFTWDLKYTFP